MDKVKIKFVGGVEDSIILRCPGVINKSLNKGDIVEVSRETYEKDFKDNFKFVLVGEKPQLKGKMLNKIEKESEAE